MKRGPFSDAVLDMEQVVQDMEDVVSEIEGGAETEATESDDTSQVKKKVNR